MSIGVQGNGTGKTTTSSSAFVNLGTDGNMEMTAKIFVLVDLKLRRNANKLTAVGSVADALQKPWGGTNGISATNTAVKAVPSVSWQEVEAAASLCLTYVTNILKNLMIPPLAYCLSNPIFQRKLGRFGGKAQFLMSAIGFDKSSRRVLTCCGIRTVH